MLKKLLFLLPFTGFIAGYFFIQFLFTTKELYVPNIVGTSFAQATELLSEQNLNIRILARKEDPTIPAYTILDQTPSANQKVKPHQSIYVVIAAQSATNRAPALVNKTVETIQLELEKIGIKPTIYHVPSPYPKDTCIAQSPAPGELLKKNSITIYCAAENKKPILWPDFRGKQLSTVRELLDTIHIVPQVIPSSRHEITESSVVLDQRPKAGTILMLDESKPINVQLSLE